MSGFRFSNPRFLILGIFLAALSGIICMQIVGRVGFTPNTSLVGAIIAMFAARLPFASTQRFRTLERQNLVQTIVSASGFSAANSGFVAVAIFYILGKTEYVLPMALGGLVGSGISVWVLGRLFDSRLFPAAAAWPPGEATATLIEAGDEGGEKGTRLLQGIILGVIGSYFKLPMAGIGIVFIANIVSMTALGLGMVIRGFSPYFMNGLELGSTVIPQGIMVGAGLVALLQAVWAMMKRNTGKGMAGQVAHTVSDSTAKWTVIYSMVLHLAGAVVVGAVAGLLGELGIGRLILWTAWCAISSLVAMFIVGNAAMRSGWFPTIGITTIFLLAGVLLRFPALSLAVMAGYICSVGPCFADMGYDLKTGWVIRGRGAHPDLERYGRKQQVYGEYIGVFIGIAVVMAFGVPFLRAGIVPPSGQTYTATILAGADIELVKQLAIWAVPGAVLQAVFGFRGAGVLFATGLLLNSPLYGVGILAAVVFRLLFGTKYMRIRDAGFIAGDGLYGFFSIFPTLFF